MTGLSVKITVSLLAVYLLKMAFIGITKVTVFRNAMVLRGKNYVWFPGRASIKKDPGQLGFCGRIQSTCSWSKVT